MGGISRERIGICGFAGDNRPAESRRRTFDALVEPRANMCVISRKVALRCGIHVMPFRARVSVTARQSGSWAETPVGVAYLRGSGRAEQVHVVAIDDAIPAAARAEVVLGRDYLDEVAREQRHEAILEERRKSRVCTKVRLCPIVGGRRRPGGSRTVTAIVDPDATQSVVRPEVFRKAEIQVTLRGTTVSTLRMVRTVDCASFDVKPAAQGCSRMRLVVGIDAKVFETEGARVRMILGADYIQRSGAAMLWRGTQRHGRVR